MSSTLKEENVFEFELFEENGSVFTAAESSWRGFAIELQELHYLKGAQFVNQLKLIVFEGEFHPVKGENNIFSAISEQSDDFDNLINAARKAVAHGYRVFVLPNPKGIRTADFIFERKGIFKLFDLKTIIGKNSVGNRLKESVGQSDCVILNLTCDYNVRNLTNEIKHYFEMSPTALEVIILAGSKLISVKRNIACSKGFLKMMMNSFHK